MATAAQRKAADPSVADEAQNRKLEHTAGGVTTRDDALDMGVPMLPGKADESVGPEDALGVGPTRGDYRGRLGPESYHPHEVVPVRDAEPGEPVVRVEQQRPRADEIGDGKGKGGVTPQ